ncbi:hypothetical protein LOK49_Contig242G00001 [Camellia lanceoleosa]|nr:hypothetical protein LOK49_Contig242G00001 [Camellia lanceoleosa]
MESNGDPFFANLLQEGSNIDSQFMESQYMSQVGLVVGHESPFSTQLESTAKKSRGGNFSIEEDNMVVSAWLNISLDVVHGNEQKNKTF